MSPEPHTPANANADGNGFADAHVYERADSDAYKCPCRHTHERANGYANDNAIIHAQAHGDANRLADPHRHANGYASASRKRPRSGLCHL